VLFVDNTHNNNLSRGCCQREVWYFLW